MVLLTLYYITVFNVIFIILNSYKNFKLIESSHQLNPVDSLRAHCYLDSSVFCQFFANVHEMDVNLVSAPYKCLCINMVDGIFFILAADSFTLLPGLPGPSQKAYSDASMILV